MSRKKADEDHPTKTELIEKHIARALEKVDTIHEGDQRKGGAEGPFQTHPGAFNDDVDVATRAEFLKAVLEPVLRSAMASFSRDLAHLKLEAETDPADAPPEG